MKKTLVIACGALSLGLGAPVRQQGVPIVSLPAATAKTATTLGALLGVRQVASGRVLVNDAGRHQIRLFDSTLATSTIVSDSTPGTSTSYGPYATSLVPFLGDSSLFADFQSQTVLVLDARGSVARLMSAAGRCPLGDGLAGLRSVCVDNRGPSPYRPPINFSGEGRPRCPGLRNPRSRTPPPRQTSSESIWTRPEWTRLARRCNRIAAI